MHSFFFLLPFLFPPPVTSAPYFPPPITFPPTYTRWNNKNTKHFYKWYFNWHLTLFVLNYTPYMHIEINVCVCVRISYCICMSQTFYNYKYLCYLSHIYLFFCYFLFYR